MYVCMYVCVCIHIYYYILIGLAPSGFAPLRLDPRLEPSRGLLILVHEARVSSRYMYVYYIYIYIERERERERERDREIDR